MKKLIKKIILHFFSRQDLFYMLYTKDERTAIINALFRRADKSLDEDFEKGKPKKEGGYDIHAICHRLAMNHMK